MAGQIDVVDYDDIGRDELIGRTTIDLEDRWFDTRWQVREIVGVGVGVGVGDGVVLQVGRFSWREGSQMCVLCSRNASGERCACLLASPPR